MISISLTPNNIDRPAKMALENTFRLVAGHSQGSSKLGICNRTVPFHWSIRPGIYVRLPMCRAQTSLGLEAFGDPVKTAAFELPSAMGAFRC